MKIRIALIIAIIAGLAATSLNIFIVRAKVTSLQSRVEEQNASRLKAEMGLTQAEADSEKAAAALQKTTLNLEKITAEKETAVAKLLALNQDLTAVRRQHDEALTELAIYSPANKPGEATTLAKMIDKLQEALAVTREENKILTRTVVNLTRVGCRGPSEGYVVTMPASLEGKVLVFDPKWNFVVLDAGEEKGVKKDGELLVNRNGKLIAKVAVRQVEKDRSIANVMPGWGFAEIREGDLIIPAHPDS